jgi:hypothetical protein
MSSLSNSNPKDNKNIYDIFAPKPNEAEQEPRYESKKLKQIMDSLKTYSEQLKEMWDNFRPIRSLKEAMLGDLFHLLSGPKSKPPLEQKEHSNRCVTYTTKALIPIKAEIFILILVLSITG